MRLHSHYDKGNKNPDLRFVKDNDRELTLARLGLVRAVAAVLKSGFVNNRNVSTGRNAIGVTFSPQCSGNAATRACIEWW